MSGRIEKVFCFIACDVELPEEWDDMVVLKQYTVDTDSTKVLMVALAGLQSQLLYKEQMKIELSNWTSLSFLIYECQSIMYLERINDFEDVSTNVRLYCKELVSVSA